MIIYEDKLSTRTFPLLQQLLPIHVQRHIVEVLDTNSTSHFYCKVEDNTPNVNVFLIEHNPKESYTTCHCYAYDRIGEDYLYNNMAVEHVQAIAKFISQLTLL
ncbi:hypothetical protein [Paenibacillus graminis]|uniref:Uncharacterized protein n=1 Tax=Paenibacillus graminis TaxID=189425 RepID=A0A089M8L0_9BACL|nr:hypothetical protein [Paenibacillus graminis]AIQ70136.1 hypothetical protein PGRAT_22645 [Paenibacillus graminis]MEC0170911.1 hypothetical protein [Paenibacillus graminis]